MKGFLGEFVLIYLLEVEFIEEDFGFLRVIKIVEIRRVKEMYGFFRL